MSWDEKLFGRLYKLLRRPRKEADAGSAAKLELLHDRLRLVGVAIAGEVVEIKEAETVGGRCGATLLLPPTVDLAPTLALNEAFYLCRVAFAATSLRQRLNPPPGLGTTEHDVFTLLAAGATLAALDQDLPSARALRAALTPHLLAVRPPLETLDPPSVCLEILARHHLGVPWEALAQAPPRAIAWARAALLATAEPTDATRLAHHAARLAGELGVARLLPMLAWGTLATAPTDSSSKELMAMAPDASGTERQGKAREGVRRVTLGKERVDENPLVHSFEKVHTAEEYSGGKKNVDGSDEMGEQGEALDEVEMREVIRSRERARSLLRADVSFEQQQAEIDLVEASGEKGIPYDEWDERARAYRPAHCLLYATRALAVKDASAVAASVRTIVGRQRGQIRSLEALFQQIERSHAWRNRQPEGSEIDLDAVVDRLASLTAGHLGTDKLYRARRPHRPRVAILILLDASLSTDAWVAGRRVLDVAKESIVVLGEALAPFSIELAIAAFSSNTRRDCRFMTIKAFEESWEGCYPRLAWITPTGYTRIGPALRHGTRVLKQATARRKLLLLVSDGKPTDYDHYEGRYGVGDVKQAVQESRQRGIQTFALALDASARRHLPQMFGRAGFETLARPEALAEAMARVCAELAR